MLAPTKIAPVFRSPRPLVHPRTRAPIRLNGALGHSGGAPLGPSFELALAVNNLVQMIAASSTFQSWTGSASAKAAASFVYMGEAPASAQKPFAVVWLQRSSAVAIADGSGLEFENAGMLALQFVEEIDDARTNRSDAYMGMLNQVGGVRKDLLTAAGTGGPALNIDTLVVRSVYRFEDPNAAAREADVFIALLEVSYRP